MSHEIPFLLYFKVMFWLGVAGIVLYVVYLGGARDYPHTETTERWEDMLGLISKICVVIILYILCWGTW